MKCYSCEEDGAKKQIDSDLEMFVLCDPCWDVFLEKWSDSYFYPMEES